MRYGRIVAVALAALLFLNMVSQNVSAMPMNGLASAAKRVTLASRTYGGLAVSTDASVLIGYGTVGMGDRKHAHRTGTGTDAGGSSSRSSLPVVR